MKTTTILLSLLLTTTLFPAYGMEDIEPEKGSAVSKTKTLDDLYELNLSILNEQRLRNAEDYYKSGLECLSKDPCEAVRLFHLAAERKHTGAEYQLGRAYETGIGVLPNPDEQEKYYKLSVQKKYPPAEYRLGLAYILMSKDKEGIELVKRAADQGYPEAQINYCNWCLTGKNQVTQNENEGLKWLAPLARVGDINAQYILAELYERKSAEARSKKDTQMSSEYKNLFLQHYGNAAQGGHEKARKRLRQIVVEKKASFVTPDKEMNWNKLAEHLMSK